MLFLVRILSDFLLDGEGVEHFREMFSNNTLIEKSGFDARTPVVVRLKPDYHDAPAIKATPSKKDP